MKTPVFVCVCILLFASYLQFYSFMRYKFSGVTDLKNKVAVLQSNLDKEKFKNELAQYQFKDFKQQVATLVPGAIQNSKDQFQSFQLRSLASIVTEPTEMKFEHASSLFEKAKEAFRKKEFKQANQQFSQLIKEYPDSIHLVESHFLLAEGEYQIKQYDACLSTVEEMVSKFPENELTGFALLRLGKVYEIQDRAEDAADVYKAVLRSYGDAGLKKQASAALQSVKL